MPSTEKSFGNKAYDFFTKDTTYTYWGFCLVVFCYFMINNNFFLNKSFSLMGVFQGLLLIIFYIILTYLLINYGYNFCKESISILNQKKIKNYKDFSDFPLYGFFILVCIFIVTMVFGFYVFPRFLVNSGFYPKGLVRIFNPFRELFGQGNGDYDDNNLFWGGVDMSSKLLFILLSLPIIAMNFLIADPVIGIFNIYLIPTIFKTSFPLVLTRLIGKL